MNAFTKHFYLICPILSSIYLYISKICVVVISIVIIIFISIAMPTS